MKLAEIKGEAAIDVLAEIIEPMAKIAADEHITETVRNHKGTIAQHASYILKNYKNEVIDILAALEGETRDQLMDHLNILTLPMKLLEVINDPMVLSAFTSAAENGAANTYGSLSENAAGEI